ncbi:MAG: uracil-DNA glycosylase [Verrucomicrobia bacterium]|nr:uracil-DNA glycosylase [Verrucomicrobiota bacterium]
MKLAKNWHARLQEEINKPYIKDLKHFLEGEETYPPKDLVFHAFAMTPYEEVKVVIMGQDPYHGQGQAHGMSFSVPEGVEPPPSLKNIYKEMQDDLGIPPAKTGCLDSWAKQGVLLLNATLTVRPNEPKSHYGRGWEQFTDAVVAKLAERKDPIVFILWGKSAKEKCASLLEHSHHAVLTAAHPSPFSAYHGFFGCRHFSKANELLKKWGKTPINWELANQLVSVK